jgi:hypothetical protein
MVVKLKPACSARLALRTRYSRALLLGHQFVAKRDHRWPPQWSHVAACATADAQHGVPAPLRKVRCGRSAKVA